ncbi:ABC transporter permease, partial [bacterium]|nr:ABC transporter permease [bacterium]
MSDAPKKHPRKTLRAHALVFYESVRMALGSVRSNKLRSVLTCLGIIIGVATVISMMSIVKGVDGIVAKELDRVGASSFVLTKYPALRVSFDWNKYRRRPDLTMEDVQAILDQCPSVDLVAPLLVAWGKTVTAEGNKTDPNIGMIGTTSDYTAIMGLGVQEGRVFTNLENRRPRLVAILGVDVVDRVFPYGSPIGRYVRVDNYRLRVVGVMEERGAMFGESQDTRIIVPMPLILRKEGNTRNLEINIKARPDVPLAKAMNEVRTVMRIRHKVKVYEEDDFELETRESITRAWSNLTGSIFAAAVGIAMISLLVGGVGIMNIMLVSVRERTREIGVRKALGARPRDIQRQFLIEASTLSLLGGVLGVSIGVGGMQALAAVTDKVPVIVTGFAVVLSLGFSILVGIFFGVYPARKAAHLDPI